MNQSDLDNEDFLLSRSRDCLDFAQDVASRFVKLANIYVKITGVLTVLSIILFSISIFLHTRSLHGAEFMTGTWVGVAACAQVLACCFPSDLFSEGD